MYYVLCIMYYVLCIMYYVLCIMYYVLCIMYYVLCIMYYVLCIMYYVLCIMYYVLCIISSKRQSFSGKICNVLRTLKRVKLSFKPVTLRGLYYELCIMNYVLCIKFYLLDIIYIHACVYTCILHILKKYNFTVSVQDSAKQG